MNWEHLKAIVWLRTRLSINQWRKGGAFNFVLMMILAGSMLSMAALSFFLSLGLGIFLFPKASPVEVQIVWDVVVGLLLFSWAISLGIEIQRQELLSLDKFLHLPMTLRDAFLLNYISSWLNLSMILFVPTTLGMSSALAYVFGVQMLLLLPITFAWILALTSLSYQFRGWLAALMSNNRRKRTVLTVFTISFIALAQVPNIVVQLVLPLSNRATETLKQERNQELQALDNERNEQKISMEEYQSRRIAINDSYNQKQKDREQAQGQLVDLILTRVNQFIPFGWLPYSAKSLSAGSAWPALLSLLGLSTMGTLSLWRSYKSTMRYYTGVAGRNEAAPASVQQTHVPREPATAIEPSTTLRDTSARATSPKRLLIERALPRISEHTSAILFCSLQNLLRAPEAKMLLVGPIVFGGLMLIVVASNRVPSLPAGTGPLAWLGAVATLPFMSMMTMLNVFGMDRNGFRCFILMPVEREAILLGKNLSLLPVFIGLALLFFSVLTLIVPIGPLTAIACVFQAAIAFLFTCIVGNWVSMYFPFSMSPNSGKPVQINLTTVLIQMLAMFLSPIVVAPAFVFYGIQWGLTQWFSIPALPILFLLSAIELLVAVKLYTFCIKRQGIMLQRRETQILEAVTAAIE